MYINAIPYPYLWLTTSSAVDPSTHCNMNAHYPHIPCSIKSHDLLSSCPTSSWCSNFWSLTATQREQLGSNGLRITCSPTIDTVLARSAANDFLNYWGDVNGNHWSTALVLALYLCLLLRCSINISLGYEANNCHAVKDSGVCDVICLCGFSFSMKIFLC